MNPSTRTSLAFLLTLSSALAFSLGGCAHRAKSLRLLDARSNYNAPISENEAGLFQGGKGSEQSLLKENAQSALVYLHPAKLPTGDWFWGGFITLSLKGDGLEHDEFESLNRDLERPAIVEIEQKKKR